MKKLTITATRSVLKMEVAEFHGNYTIPLYIRGFWYRLCWRKAFKANGYTLTDSVSDCTLADIQRTTKFQ